MTQEEKAKAYDEVLEKAKSWYIDAQIDFKKSLENLFPELAMSEDERIRKMLIGFFSKGAEYNSSTNGISDKDIIAWLEKMGEHLKFCKTIQIGDRVTRNEGGVLVNMSQLDRIAKKCKKQGEQKVNYTTLVETGNGGINALVTRELPTNGGDEQEQDVNIQINPSEYINDMGGNGCYLKNTTQTSTWSEEDERERKHCIDFLNHPDMIKVTPTVKKNCIDWLKSLKDKYSWKPSKEQMEALKEVCDEHWEPDGLDPLYTLYQDLKKLKGE